MAARKGSEGLIDFIIGAGEFDVVFAFLSGYDRYGFNKPHLMNSTRFSRSRRMAVCV